MDGTGTEQILSTVFLARGSSQPFTHLPWLSEMTEIESAGIAFDAVDGDDQLLDRLMAAESNLDPLIKAEQEEDWIPSEMAQQPADNGKVGVSPHSAIGRGA